MRDALLPALVGVGTGSLREHYEKILAGASSKARGLTDSELAGKQYEFGNPNLLVRLALEHDRVINY